MSSPPGRAGVGPSGLKHRSPGRRACSSAAAGLGAVVDLVAAPRRERAAPVHGMVWVGDPGIGRSGVPRGESSRGIDVSSPPV